MHVQPWEKLVHFDSSLFLSARFTPEPFLLSLLSVLSRRKEAGVLDGPGGTLNNIEITLLFFFFLQPPTALWLLPRHWGLLLSLTLLFFILRVSQLQLQNLARLGAMSCTWTVKTLDDDLWTETNSWGINCQMARMSTRVPNEKHTINPEAFLDLSEC